MTREDIIKAKFLRELMNKLPRRTIERDADKSPPFDSP